MARPSPKEWIARNPPRKGETSAQYRQRYEDETRPGLLEEGADIVSNLARGGALGLAKTGTSFARGIGELGGTLTPGLRSWAREAEQGAQEYLNPQGTAGAVGEFVGRAAGEIGTSLAGGGLIAKGLSKAGSVGRAISAGTKSSSALKRALSTAAASSPIDVIQGAGQDSGMILGGRSGAILENLAFSGAGGALSATLDARRAAREAAARKPITDPRRMLPAAGETVEFSGAPLAPLRAGRGLPQVQQAGPELGQARKPIRALTPEERGVAIVPFRQGAATPVVGAREAGEEVAQDVTALRQQLANMSEADVKRWMAMNMPDASEEELLQMMTEMLPVRQGRRGLTSMPLQEVEARSLRSRPAMMRSRRGAAAGDLLSSLTGGVGGGLYGAATGETEEERLARALAFGTAGAGLGLGASRFFRGGDAAIGQDIREAERTIVRGVRDGAASPPKTGAPMADFPKNRRPLVGRSGVEALDPAEKVLLESRIREIEPTITRPKTEADVRREAQQILGSKSMTELLALNPERTTAAESLATLTLHRDLRKQVLDNVERLKTATDADEIAELTDNIESLDTLSAKFLSRIMNADTAAGRSLAARRFMAKDITDPTYWYIKASRVKGGDILSDAEKLQIDKLSREANPEKLLQYLASIQKSSKLEQVASLRSTGLLTAFPGRLRDLISTSANYVSTVAQRYPGALADAMAAKIVANRTGGAAAQYRTMLAPSRDELGDALRGARQGLIDAANSMGYNAAKQGGLEGWVNAIRQAEIDPEMAKRLEVPSLVNIDMFSGRLGEKANVFLDTYSKAVMRSAGVTDKIINSAALKGALNEQARLVAKRTGQSVEELLAKPTDEMLLNAKQAADYITFTNDGTIANGIAGAIERFAAAAEAGKKGNGALVRAGARLIMPFRRTPSNILSRALEYSPGVGTAMTAKAVRDWTKELAMASLQGVSPELAKSQRRMVEMLTKQATGASMFALGAMLYNNGRLTGEMPENAAEREQWSLEGKKPESILINDEWVPISRISPFGGMMTLAASVLRNAEKLDPNASTAQRTYEAATKGAEATLRSVMNQPMVTGPQEALNALTGRSERNSGSPLADFAGSMAGSFVPTVVAQAARAEGIQRRPENLVQEIASRIPGLQEMAPARLDIFGEPVRSGGGAVNTMLNPLTSTADRRATDPLVAELSRVGANIAPMSRKKGETTEMYNYRQREAGRVIRQELAALIQTGEYRSLPAKEQRRLIADTIRSVRRELSDYLEENFGITSGEDEA
jgi:hypothetical protein